MARHHKRFELTGIHDRTQTASASGAEHDHADPAVSRAAIAAAAGPASFQVVADSDFAVTDAFQVHTVVPSNQITPRAAALSSGGFITAWEHGSGIKLQLFDRNGEKVGTEVLAAPVSQTTNHDQPAVAGLAGGGFVVCWSLTSSSTGYDIRARLFDAQGQAIGSDFAVNTALDNHQQQPSVTGLSGGGFVVAWTSLGSDGSQSGIRAQIFDAAGHVAGAEFDVNTTTQLDQYYPLAQPLPGGGFVVTWANQFDSNTGGQIFDSAGNKVGTEFSSSIGLYALTVLSNGNFVVAGEGATGELAAQIYSPTGTAIGGVFQINTVTENNQDSTVLAALPNGGFVASWRQAVGNINFFEDGEIKAQVFDANGGKVGDEFMVNPGTAGGQLEPAIVSFGSGDFGVMWRDYPGSTTSDIQMRLYFSSVEGDGTANNMAGTADRDFYEGRGGDDQLSGGAANDSLSGSGGNDVLDGGTGADRLDGGTENDTYYVDNAGDVIVEAAGQGYDTAYASVSYVLGAGVSVEVLSAASWGGLDPLALTGNGFANTLYGNAGANVLDGGGGADVLIGQGGDDLYFLDNAGDAVVEGAGGGFDTVFTGVSYTLGAGVAAEILSVVSWTATTPIALTGNEFANRLYGNAGANVLTGGAGDDWLTGFGGGDTLVGGQGDDVYWIHAGNDAITETAGNGYDTVYAFTSYVLGADANVEVVSTYSWIQGESIDLTGNGLANVLFGNVGANVLNGGLGNDRMTGFGGADTFAFTTALGADNVDTVVDFVAGTDKVALDDAIFTQAGGLGALNANAFVTGSAAGDTDDRIIYNSTTGALLYDADGNGAGAAVQFATLSPGLSLSASDFMVI